ncbi:MAG: S8 family serine peptidase [Solirubrobacteraceae bacterium]
MTGLRALLLTVALLTVALLIVGPASLADAAVDPTGPPPSGCDQTLDTSPRNFDAPASHDPYQQYCLPNVQRNDTPSDPSYDQSEPDTQNQTPPDTNLYDERFDLFGFPSSRSLASAKYADLGDLGEIAPAGPDGISRFGKPQVSGFNAAGAWKVSRGDPNVTVAILDTGIRWNQEGLRRQIHLNTGELPYPEVDPAMAPSLDPANPSLSCATLAHGSVKAADGAYLATSYDPLGGGAPEVDDYACDPRVAHVIAAGYAGRFAPTGPGGGTLITGQDLLHTFGHCRIDASGHTIVPASGAASGAPGCPDSQSVDNDANGYANDIAGWNFFDNNNDPTDLSSYFQAAGHGSGRASDAVERGNDHEGAIGVCPHCQFMPVRVWDTFVSDGHTFGLGIAYATDNRVRVIEGADGNLYHSAFTEAASNYAYAHGVVQTYSGDDLNTGDHNYPGNYSHAMLIQGTVPDAVGLGTSSSIPSPPSGTPAPLASELNAIRGQFLSLQNAAGAAGFGSDVPPTTYFRGANTTQYGGHSSVSMEGTTGSQNTGKASGAAALVISAAQEHGIGLTPDETREILEQTAERAVTPNSGTIGSPDRMAPATCVSPATPASSHGACATPDLQWTEHFGWGRVDLGAAVAVAASGKIPPIAAIHSPDWYAPETGASIDISGLARAPRATGQSLRWKLMWAPGVQPASDSWTVAASGSSSGTVTNFGSIDLTAVRTALAAYVAPADAGAPTFSATAPNPYAGQFSVQLEVNGQGLPIPGIDRRVFTAVKDPSLEAGFPKRMCQANLGSCSATTPASGGEAPIRYADLTGTNEQQLLVPTEDGFIHAYQRNGSELPGWPVRTEPQSAAAGHDSSPALKSVGVPHEPPRAAAVADLTGTGHPDVITAAGVHVYAWRANGQPVAGFPVSEDLAHCGPALESQALQERPKCGFLASPAVGYLQGRSQGLDIVEPGLDGYLYAWNAHGQPLPNFPVRLRDAGSAPATEIAESINDPALGNLTGAPDGHQDVVIATNDYYGPGAAGNGGDVSFFGSLSQAAGGSTRVYAVDGESGKYLSGWPISIPGIIQNVLPLVGPGNDPSIASVQGKPEVITSATGGALAEIAPNGRSTTTIQQQSYGPSSNATDRSGGLNLFEGAVEGNLLGTPGSVDVVKYELGLADAANLLLSGQNVPYNHLIGAWDAGTGASLGGFPTVTDDYQFLSSSEVAKVASGPTNQVVAGTGLGLLHAYDGLSGHDVSGFPKVTGGWLFAPATLSNDGRMADITREGYLFAWNVGQTPCQPTGTEWPSFRHDPLDSGNYNTDGTPPASPATVRLTGKGHDSYGLTFVTPGNDGFCGHADHYLASAGATRLSPSTIGLGSPGAGGSPTSVTVKLPAGARQFAFQAVDAAGNLGAPATLDVPAPGQTTTGGGRPVGLPPTPGGGGHGRSACPKASGRARGLTLGALRLGMTRGRAHRALKRHSTHGKRYEDFFCIAGGGIRVGYASSRLLRRLSRAERHRLQGRIVEILTANRHYALRGVRPGTRLGRLPRRLRVGRGFRVGRNTWYEFSAGRSRGLLKVRHRVIEEIGIAERSLTRNRSISRRFLRTFY